MKIPIREIKNGNVLHDIQGDIRTNNAILQQRGPEIGKQKCIPLDSGTPSNYFTFM